MTDHQRDEILRSIDGAMAGFFRALIALDDDVTRKGEAARAGANSARLQKAQYQSEIIVKIWMLAAQTFGGGINVLDYMTIVRQAIRDMERGQ